MGRPYTHPGTIIPVVMETPPRRPYVSPPPHPTNTTRPLPPLARCLFYHPPAPLLEPPFRESTRNSYRSADEFEVLRILRGVLLTTGSSLSLSLSLPFCLSFSFSLDFSPRSFFPRPFRLLRVASPRPRRPYFGSEKSSTPFPHPPSYQESRVIGSRRVCVCLHAFAARVPSRDPRQRRNVARRETSMNSRFVRSARFFARIYAVVFVNRGGIETVAFVIYGWQDRIMILLIIN